MLIAIAIAEGIQGLGRKKDSLELKAIKAQIKNDEKQKAAQRIKELKKQWGEETESDVKFWGEIWKKSEIMTSVYQPNMKNTHF